MTNTQEALLDIRMIGNSGLYEMSRIEWWLLKYADHYNFIKSNWCCGRCPKDLPCICQPKAPELVFRDTYKALDKISHLHKMENYFRYELEEFEQIKLDIDLLKNWLIRNEKLGTEDYRWFCEEHLDRPDHPDDIYVLIPGSTEFEVFIQRSDFKYTLQFFNLFKDLYWKKRLLPNHAFAFEEAERIEMEIMKKLNSEQIT